MPRRFVDPAWKGPSELFFADGCGALAGEASAGLSNDQVRMSSSPEWLFQSAARTLNPAMTQAQIDRLFGRIRDICLALPEAKEVVAWGHPTFRAPKKMFAACGTDKDGSASVGLKVGFDRQEDL